MRNVGITIIDSYFAFVLHITLICSRASQTLDLVIRILKHGLSDDAAVVLYLCHSSVNYSSMFWLSGLPTSLGRAIISFKRCGCALSGSWDAVLVTNSFMSQFMSRVHGLLNLEYRRRVADRPPFLYKLLNYQIYSRYLLQRINIHPPIRTRQHCLFELEYAGSNYVRHIPIRRCASETNLCFGGSLCFKWYYFSCCHNALDTTVVFCQR